MSVSVSVAGLGRVISETGSLQKPLLGVSLTAEGVETRQDVWRAAFFDRARGVGAADTKGQGDEHGAVPDGERVVGAGADQRQND